MTELIVDSFAGGGGASCGIYQATGRHPDVAINHDAEAIALHRANHPTTRHLPADVWSIDPRDATGGRAVGLLWASPDCTHHSRAKGSKPVSNKRRGLAWAVTRWAHEVRPRVIALENVEEFREWGPLDRTTQRPRPERRGETFRAWVRRLERLGYHVEWRSLRACDYGAPTIRRRLFLVARCDGEAIRWPAPTHGPGRALAHPAAGDCIDWSTPGRSIFRDPPLSPNTLRRIANGLRRYVIETDRPYLVGHAAHFLTEHANASTPRSWAPHEPLRTVCANVKGGHFALVSAFLAKHYTERHAGEVMAASLFDPAPTVTTVDHNALVAAHLGLGDVPDKVRAFFVAYYGAERDGADLFTPMRTITTKDRLGLVRVHGEDYAITDITMRMLSARELYRAQGFPETYVIDRGVTDDGDTMPLNLTAQKRMAGNSVCPPVAAAVVRANYGAAVGRVAA